MNIVQFIGQRLSDSWLWFKWLCYENPWPLLEPAPEIIEIPGIDEFWIPKEVHTINFCTTCAYGHVPLRKWPVRKRKVHGI